MAQTRLVVETKCGKLNCDVVGDLEKAPVVLLTVHDLGCNSTSWKNFVNHPSMAGVLTHATWLHVNLPGQEDNAPELPEDYTYPTMDEMAEALVDVVAQVHCPVIAIGEGAGANIVARYVLTSPKALHGAVLIHCTSTTAGFMESIQEKMVNWKLLGGMNMSAENFLIVHRFGDFSKAADAQQVRHIVDRFQLQLEQRMNAKNIRKYIDCFRNRTAICDKFGSLKVPILLITGAKANHNHTVHTLYNAALRAVEDRKKIEFIEVADVANVVEGAPEKLSESLLFFAQGCGLMAGVSMPHLGQKASAKSMQQMDKSDI